MGVSLVRWRAVIGSWSCVSISHSQTKHSSDESSILWFSLLIVAMLLVIGGIELNPGPHQARGFHRQVEKSRPRLFDRRAGTSDMTGELFEVNVASLFFMRGMFQTDGFHLATNVDQAGAFDDLVFKFKDWDTKLEYTCFLQLKTKLERLIKYKDLIACTGDFSLLKYYTSYCDIQEEFSTQTDSVAFAGLFQNCEFIIYTNTKLESEDSWDDVPVSGSPENILYCGGNNGRIFCLNLGSKESNTAYNILETYKKELEGILEGDFSVIEIRKRLEVFRSLHLCYDLLKVHKNEEVFYPLLNEQLKRIGDRCKWEEFLKKLKVYTCQSIEGELETKVKQNLETYCGVSGTKTQEMFIKLKSSMIEWWRKEGYFLTESYAPFWDKIIEDNISNLVSPLCSKTTIVAQIKFQEKQDISHTSRVKHIVTHGTTILGCLKVQQSLADVGHIMVESSTLQNHSREVLSLWGKGSWYNVLVIEGETDSQDAIAGVVDVLNSCSDKQIIVIACESDLMAKTLSETFHSTKYRDSFSLNQLDDESQALIFNCKVNFQGIPVSLQDMAASDILKSVTSSDTVVELVNGFLKVGEKLPEEDDYYIVRTFVRREIVDMQILTVKTYHYLAVSGMSVQQLQQLVPPGDIVTKFEVHSQTDYHKCRFFVIENEDDFSKLCNLFDNIHWLYKQGNSLIWKISKGDAAFVTSYASNKTYNNLKEIMDISEQVVLVVAEPGMGKSTEVSHLALELKSYDPTTWVVIVNLNDYTEYLRHGRCNTFELLEKAGKFSEQFQKTLFEHELKHRGNFVVLFDGFDEISPNYADKVIHMILELRKTKIKKLFVTTRPIMREKLEAELSSLHFEFVPFSLSNQTEFLLKFWKIKSINYDIKAFIDKLLELTERSINDRLSTFTGIPLQTRMLAEAFQTEAEHFSNTSDIRLPQKLDILQLYNRFIKSKWEIYYSEKSGVDISKVAVSEDYDELKEKFRKNHMNCALVTLLDMDDVKKLHDADKIIKKYTKFVKKFRKFRDRIGVIVEIVCEKAVFAHRTFAEYFAALWFSKKFEAHTKYIVQKFLEPDFQIIRNFFDRILAKDFELHIAVLNEDRRSVQKLLLEQHFDVNTRDQGGRTALHLAVLCYIDAHDDVSQSLIIEIIVILLDHGANTNIEDMVLCWRPLQIADRIRAWAPVDLLLQRQADSNDLVLTKQNTTDKKFVQDVLVVACRQGYIQIVAFMIQCSVSVDETISVGNMLPPDRITMLHKAAEHGQLELVQFLVAHNADIEAQDNFFEITPLIRAAERGHRQIVEYLLKQRANIDARDSQGSTALLKAAEHGQSEVFKLLIDYKKDNIMTCDDYEFNILHNAAMSGNEELVKYVLNTFSFDIDCRTKINHTPLWCAAEYGHVNIVRLLGDLGASLNVKDDLTQSTPLHIAANKGQLQVVECLLEYGASVSEIDRYGNTPLLKAADSGQFEVFKLLSQNDENLMACNEFGMTVLHYAATSSNVDLTRYILDNVPLLIDTCNKRGQTPLWLAARQGNLKGTQLLCERDADLHIQDYEVKFTPLHAAVERGHLQVVQCLVQHRASLTTLDKWDNTPLAIALELGKLDVAEVLQNITQ